MEEIEECCPAKVNLFLAVTGRRADGFHELVSLMVPLDLGDRLRMGWREGEDVTFLCNDKALPQGEENLVLRAVAAFRRRHPFRRGLCIDLEKRIPVGAGLGGGSSDAAGALLCLNRLLGEPAARAELHELAASIGSDCPFFLDREAAVVRGRGERIERLPERVRERLRGTRLLLVKPSFPISTAWAYGALAGVPEDYAPPERAEGLLKEWLTEERPIANLLFNNLEAAVFRKFIPLAALKNRLEGQLGLPVLMSGSGSTLFAVLEEGREAVEAKAAARDALGPAGWLAEARVL